MSRLALLGGGKATPDGGGASLPDAPTDLVATPSSTSQIDLSWIDNATNEDGYKIYRSADGVSYSEIDNIAADLESYNDATITAGTRYYYKVAAYNGVGEAESSASYTNTLEYGLVAYWKADEASGDLLDDKDSHDGTDTNTVGTAAGIISTAREFVAANLERFQVADHADLRSGVGDWSMDGWIYPTPSGTYHIAGKGASTSPANYDWQLFVVATTVTFRGSDGTSSFDVSASGSATIGAWNYWYIQYEAATKKIGISLNHGALAESTLTNPINSTAHPLHIGCRMAGTPYFNGRMDETGRYNRLLTVDERASRYNGGSGNTRPFDSGGSSPLPLYSGSFTYSSSID